MRFLSPLTNDWSLSRRDPDDVWGDFDNFFSSFMRPTYAGRLNFQPTYDVKETKEHFLLTFDLPGVKKEDIKIETKGDQLTISGERSREGKAFKYERTFGLPNNVNTEKIEAQYENGVLSIALPKAEAAQGRRIEIQSGQTGFFSKLLGAKKEETPSDEKAS